MTSAKQIPLQCPIGLHKYFFILNFNEGESIHTSIVKMAINVQTMRKMDNLHLLDFVELKVNSIHDFEGA